MKTKADPDMAGSNAPELAQNAPVVASRRSPRLRQRVAWMYYVEEMTQSAIADALGIGRITVVRLLSEARAMNEVRISLSREVAALSRLEIGLQKAYGDSRGDRRAAVLGERRSAARSGGGGGRIRLGHAAAGHEDRARLGHDAERNR